MRRKVNRAAFDQILEEPDSLVLASDLTFKLQSSMFDLCMQRYTNMQIVGLHHIQLAMPKGGEDLALGFYRDVLGLPQVAKPAELAGRGGVWFEQGTLRLHLGVEDGFRPARKAHPAFQVSDLTALITHLKAHAIEVRPDNNLAGFHRVFVDDPFGNRIELLQPVD